MSQGAQIMIKLIISLIFLFSPLSFASEKITISEMKTQLAAGMGIMQGVDVSSLSDLASCNEIREFFELKGLVSIDELGKTVDISVVVTCVE